MKQGVPFSRDLLNVSFSHLTKKKNHKRRYTLGKGISDVVPPNRRSQKLRPQTRKAQALWMSLELRPERVFAGPVFEFAADSSRSLRYCSSIQCRRQNLLREGGKVEWLIRLLGSRKQYPTFA